MKGGQETVCVMSTQIPMDQYQEIESRENQNNEKINLTLILPVFPLIEFATFAIG